jgi:hypothetical protein
MSDSLQTATVQAEGKHHRQRNRLLFRAKGAAQEVYRRARGAGAQDVQPELVYVGMERVIIHGKHGSLKVSHALVVDGQAIVNERG